MLRPYSFAGAMVQWCGGLPLPNGLLLYHVVLCTLTLPPRGRTLETLRHGRLDLSSFLQQGGRGLLWALQPDAIHAGGRLQCLGTDQTRPDHLSKTAEAVERYRVYRVLAAGSSMTLDSSAIQFQDLKYPVRRQTTAEQRSEASSRLRREFFGVVLTAHHVAPVGPCTYQSTM